MPTPSQPGKSSELLMARVAELRAALKAVDPYLLAQRTGVHYDPGGGEFRLHLWGRDVRVHFPELTARPAAGQGELNPAEQALLTYYFYTADGTPLSQRWISFSELPDGRFYTQAFQGYTGKELARVFGNDRQAFTTAAGRLGGVAHKFGDLGFIFPVLPRVAFLVAFWEGDEDFPSSFQVLFDASTSHCLPTDACAVAGSLLTRRLAAAKE